MIHVKKLLSLLTEPCGMLREQSKRYSTLLSRPWETRVAETSWTDFLYLSVTCNVLIIVVSFYWIPQTPVVKGQLSNL